MVLAFCDDFAHYARKQGLAQATVTQYRNHLVRFLLAVEARSESAPPFR